MVTIREEKIADIAAREALLDEAYGPARFAKASERLREGRLPATGLSLVAVERGRLVGTVRLWNVSAGPGRAAVLLGPLAVHPAHRNRGIGTTLVRRAIARARHRRPWRDSSGRRCAVLRPLRFFRFVDRRAVDARPLRSRPASRARTQARRSRWGARPDRRRRAACAGARSGRPGGGRSARRKRSRPTRSRGLAAKHKKSGTPRTKIRGVSSVSALPRISPRYCRWRLAL